MLGEFEDKVGDVTGRHGGFLLQTPKKTMCVLIQPKQHRKKTQTCGLQASVGIQPKKKQGGKANFFKKPSLLKKFSPSP